MARSKEESTFSAGDDEDLELVSRVLDGDYSAFEEIVNRYDDKAYRLNAEFDINRGQFGMDYGLADAAIRDEVVIRLKFELPKP